MVEATSLLFGILGQAPGYLAILAGIALAAIHWRSHPRASLLTLAAMVLMLAQSLLSTLVYRVFYMSIVSSLGGVAVSAIGLAQSLGHAVALGLLLAAVYVGRPADA